MKGVVKMNREEQIKLIKNLLYEAQGYGLIIIYDDRFGTRFRDISQKLVALFPQEQKSVVPQNEMEKER